MQNLGDGTVVSALDARAWQQVRTADGTVGWVAAEYLEPIPDEVSFGVDAGPSASHLPSNEPDHQFTFEELRPTIEAAAREYGTDPEIVAGIIAQESGFKNHLVHPDGTGHGLIGLNDNLLLPDFERWSGGNAGRGTTAASIPPEVQIAYLARVLAAYTEKCGSPFAAARAWHRGEGRWNDRRGATYERHIRNHIGRLFP